MKKNIITPEQNQNFRQIRAKHFFGSAFKEFSLYDNVRSIPKLTDGLKPSQRKAIYGTQLRGENAGLISVERLSASVAACFPAETLILLGDGTYKSIGEIAFLFNSGETVEVMSKQEDGSFKSSAISNAFVSKFVDELIELQFEECVVRCTPEHLILTEAGWKEAGHLTCDDNIISFNKSINTVLSP